MIDALQARDHVGKDREERHEEGDDQQHRLRFRDIDQQQRRDGDDRGHLQDHRKRKQRQFHPLALHQDDRHGDAPDQGQDQRGKGDPERHQQGGRQGRPVVDQRGHHVARRGQDVFGDAVEHHGEVPGDHCQHQHGHRHHDSQHPLGIRGARPEDGDGAVRAGFVVGVGGCLHDVAHQCVPPPAWMASCSACDTSWVVARYSSEVRYSASRAPLVLSGISANTWPGRAFITTMRLLR